MGSMLDVVSGGVLEGSWSDLGKLLGGQDAPKTAQDGARTAQDGAKTPQDDAKRAPDRSTTGEVGAKIDPRASKHKNIEKTQEK